MDAPIENNKIEIEPETLRQLNSTRKWAMFLAIIGFIVLGLLIIIGIIAGTFISAFSTGQKELGIPESLLFIPFLLLAAIYFFPVMFLFQFSRHTSHAIQSLDKMELHKGIKNLKLYFAYIGILIIIVLSFYIVIIIVAGSSWAFLKGLG